MKSQIVATNIKLKMVKIWSLITKMRAAKKGSSGAKIGRDLQLNPNSILCNVVELPQRSVFLYVL